MVKKTDEILQTLATNSSNIFKSYKFKRKFSNRVKIYINTSTGMYTYLYYNYLYHKAFLYLFIVQYTSSIRLIIFFSIGLASPDSSRTTGGNKTDLTTGAGTTFHSGCLTNMLVITTTVRMLHWVHSNTTNLKTYETCQTRRFKCNIS